jgi:hypothetical protein
MHCLIIQEHNSILLYVYIMYHTCEGNFVMTAVFNYCVGCELESQKQLQMYFIATCVFLCHEDDALLV